MKNILSIDIEDYFQVENFKEYINYDEWDNYECRIEKNVVKILNILDTFDYKATFFVLGWIAQRYPNLIREIFNQGHEIATHGYGHELIYKQSEKEFENDLLTSINIIEDIIDDKILGYRAPSFSITNESYWSLDIIKNLGLQYDASIFPIKGHDRYGLSNVEPEISELNNGLYEIPPATIKFLGKRWPIAGGGFFRLFPYWLTKMGIKRLNRKRKPAVIYLHPWELDPEQPRIKAADIFSKFRHYVNLDKTEKKFKKLLSDFQFTSISDYLDLKKGDNNA